MRRQALGLAALMLAFCSLPLVAQETPGQMVVNGDVTAVFEGPDGQQQFSGRMSGHLILNGDSFEDGVLVEALNVALFGVDQQLLTGREKRGKPTGVVGFSVAVQSKERQRLRFDPSDRSLVGQLKGQLDMPQLYEMIELKLDPQVDLVEIPPLTASLEIRIGLEGMGPEILSNAREKPMEAQLSTEMVLATEGSGSLLANDFKASIISRFVDTQIVILPLFEAAQQLCIQPVRIMSFASIFPLSFNFSGDGLSFGQPGNNTQWAKADVIFTYRDWVTKFQPQFSTFSSGESSDLLALVDVDDCIEVFFVDRFSPQSLFGGGATFGLGLASSKVISSDENADFGVDLTHLAHEIGHVVGLPHPTVGNISSTGTLMCPSGFNNDNPKRNSQENKDNLSNPLLTFTLKFVSPGPDCQNSADCGPCP